MLLPVLAICSCFIFVCPALSIETFDFAGITLKDDQGNVTTDFKPGKTIQIEAAFSFKRAGAAILHGTITAENWSQDLSPKIRFGLHANYTAVWTQTIPSTVNGQVRVDVTLLSPLHERLVRSAFFTVTPIQAEYVGAKVCNTCHPSLYAAWQQTRHYPAVGCESCHGPGSEHVLTRSPEFIVIDTSSGLCGRCHSRNDGTVIEAEGGFIKSLQQFNEWRATAHGNVAECGTCHNPHYSLSTDRADALKVSCIECHAGKTVSLSMQTVACEECHMPFAGLKSQSSGTGLYRTGDIRSHLWRIKTEADPQTMFSPDGTALAQDSKGAFLTDNFACLGCHNGINARFEDFESVRKTSTLIH